MTSHSLPRLSFLRLRHRHSPDLASSLDLSQLHFPSPLFFYTLHTPFFAISASIVMPAIQLPPSRRYETRTITKLDVEKKKTPLCEGINSNLQILHQV